MYKILVIVKIESSYGVHSSMETIEYDNQVMAQRAFEILSAQRGTSTNVIKLF